MALCSGIRADGGRCKAQAMRNSAWCIGHDPDQAEARRRRASNGGKRGGRGRPSAELAKLQARFEELAEKVLSEEIERGVGAVAGQLLNGARACVRDALAAREQEELVVVPQRYGPPARFPTSALKEAYLNLMERMGAAEDAPPEHPLLKAVRNSPDPKWQNSFYFVEDADE